VSSCPDPELPDGSRVEAQLALTRASLQRLSPVEALAAQRVGALLVDTRSAVQRSRQGEIPGAIVIDRTVLEWRLDPTGAYRIPEAEPGVRVVVLCRQGYSSGFAAESLRRLGVDATDVVGGVEAWAAAGLPVDGGPADVRE
jgi:rhodanese-related sulfurtransferase